MSQKQVNTELLGISAEMAMCELAGVEPVGIRGRTDASLTRAVTPVLEMALKSLPVVTRHAGSDRRGVAKSTFDFELEGGKRLSLKTNFSKGRAKVCPPVFGQGGADNYWKAFGDLYRQGDRDERRGVSVPAFKRISIARIDIKMERYLDSLFDCDYLIWLWQKPVPGFRIFQPSNLPKLEWRIERFSFSQTVESWNESCSVRYQPTDTSRRLSLGEFQVHRNRAGYKFRLNLNNLAKLIDGNY
jgi:hypothetical protein